MNEHVDFLRLHAEAAEHDQCPDEARQLRAVASYLENLHDAYVRLLDASLQQDREIEKLRSQLPDGMKNCTIVFKQCERGHGRLVGTNWVDHGCGVCEQDRLRVERDKLRDAIRRYGLQICQTSGDWSLHDLSDLAQQEQARTDEIIVRNIDLESENRKLREALGLLIAAGNAMPRRTKQSGGCGDESEYTLSNGAVWDFDRAMTAAEKARTQ